MFVWCCSTGIDGKDIARVSAFSKRHLEALEPGHRLVIGGFELEVQDEFHGEIECENLSGNSFALNYVADFERNRRLSVL
uniref:YCII-related domain-containing protein n=1 Tax=Parascaris equorum TaxID=6256 RepID=A0A914RFD0_PAREQ